MFCFKLQKEKLFKTTHHFYIGKFLGIHISLKQKEVGRQCLDSQADAFGALAIRLSLLLSDVACLTKPNITVLKHLMLFFFSSKHSKHLILSYFYSISNGIVLFTFMSVILLSYVLYNTSHIYVCIYIFKYRNKIKYTWSNVCVRDKNRDWPFAIVIMKKDMHTEF